MISCFLYYHQDHERLHCLCFLTCRILFKDKDRNWDDIESKLRAESEVPIVKTSSMV